MVDVKGSSPAETMVVALMCLITGTLSAPSQSVQPLARISNAELTPEFTTRASPNVALAAIRLLAFAALKSREKETIGTFA
jgi:hypothetical protein